MNFSKYMNALYGNPKKAIKVEWLNPDETVKFEFTNSLYDIGVDMSVNYQNGSRRSCTITLNNDRNRFSVDFNNIWFGQKFKLWMGVYLDEKTPYYLPQGVFYVSNPNEIYQPATKTIKINGVDKWAFLDGTLNGVLTGTYQTAIGTNLFDATKDLLLLPTWAEGNTKKISSTNFDEYFDTTSNFPSGLSLSGSHVEFTPQNKPRSFDIVFKKPGTISFDISYSVYDSYSESKLEIILSGAKIFGVWRSNVTRPNNIVDSNNSLKLCKVNKGDILHFEFLDSHANTDYVAISNIVFTDTNHIDTVAPFFSPSLLSKTTHVLNTDSEYDETKTYYERNGREYTEYLYVSSNEWKEDYDTLYVLTDVWKCPYTAKVERGKTYADVLLEYATILCAHIYYDVNGRLVLEPMIDTADDITDTNKEILWHYTIEEKSFLGLNQEYKFDKIYNDIIVLGNIVNGYQFKARVQNSNVMSNTCIQKIGAKTKPPIEDNQYYSDDQCAELAMYYAKVDTILQKSGNISSIPLYHLDVNKLISVSTPGNHMSKELFLITGFTLNASGTTSVNVTSVNILKDFSVVEVGV